MCQARGLAYVFVADRHYLPSLTPQSPRTHSRLRLRVIIIEGRSQYGSHLLAIMGGGAEIAGLDIGGRVLADRTKAQYTPPTPTRRDKTVSSRRRRRCVLGLRNMLSFSSHYHGGIMVESTMVF